jgi:hypothetical protein
MAKPVLGAIRDVNVVSGGGGGSPSFASEWQSSSGLVSNNDGPGIYDVIVDYDALFAGTIILWTSTAGQFTYSTIIAGAAGRVEIKAIRCNGLKISPTAGSYKYFMARQFY